MDEKVRRAELAKFLRNRRAAISPEAFGLPKGSRRRTPGLRREELALRANIGLAWYTWIEQQRDIQVSPEVVSRIATALNLTPSDRTYLESLASQPPQPAEPSRSEAIEEAQSLLDGFTAGPAMLWNARFDCLAYNRLADAVYEWSGSVAPFGRNVAWRSFVDDTQRDMYSQAEHLMHNCVGMLRSRYASHLGEPGFESLIKVLLDESELFTRWWAEQHTASLEPASFVLKHRQYGSLALRAVRAIFPPIPESTLVFGCPLDEPTKRVFQTIALDESHEAGPAILP
jgi:transcriptional regulator with XRE-family HTH domain